MILNKTIKKIFILTIVLVLIGLISCAIRDLYDSWRLYLYDLDGDEIFHDADESLPGFSQFQSRYFGGVPKSLGVIVSIPFVLIAACLYVCVLNFLEKKNFSFLSSFSKRINTIIGKKRLLVCFALSLIVEIIIGVILYFVYNKKIVFSNTQSFLRQDTPLFIFMFSGIFFIITSVTILLTRQCVENEIPIRCAWIYLMYIFIYSIFYDYSMIHKDSFLFLFIPISSLIPSLCLPIRRADIKAVSLINYFKFIIGLFLILISLETFYPFMNHNKIDSSWFFSNCFSFYLIISGILNFSVVERICSRIKRSRGIDGGEKRGV